MTERRAVPVAATLQARRDAGHKLLGPYVTGQLRADWLDVMSVYVESGADVIEVGIPFSDPVMDGPTIQAASSVALERGATPLGILSDLATLDWPIPVVVMTYYNLVLHLGLDRFAEEAAAAGVGGVILPDVPIEELEPWWEAAKAHGLETIGLVGPVTPDDRLARVCDAASGFVYGVNLMGVTGERTDVSADSALLASRIKAVTDLPALMGFGISTPMQAATVAAASDGVIVASAIMRRLLEGATINDAGAFVRELRAAVTSAS